MLPTTSAHIDAPPTWDSHDDHREASPPTTKRSAGSARSTRPPPLAATVLGVPLALLGGKIARGAPPPPVEDNAVAAVTAALPLTSAAAKFLRVGSARLTAARPLSGRFASTARDFDYTVTSPTVGTSIAETRRLPLTAEDAIAACHRDDVIAAARAQLRQRLFPDRFVNMVQSSVAITTPRHKAPPAAPGPPRSVRQREALAVGGRHRHVVAGPIAPASPVSDAQRTRCAQESASGWSQPARTPPLHRPGYVDHLLGTVDYLLHADERFRFEAERERRSRQMQLAAGALTSDAVPTFDAPPPRPSTHPRWTRQPLVRPDGNQRHLQAPLLVEPSSSPP